MNWSQHKFALQIILITIISLLTACGGGSSNSNKVTNTEVVVSNINITKYSLEFATNNSFQLEVNAEFSDGSSKDITSDVTWEINNTDLATISNTGLLTTYAIVDELIVTATYQSISTTIKISILPNSDATIVSLILPEDTQLSDISSGHIITVAATYSDGSINETYEIEIKKIEHIGETYLAQVEFGGNTYSITGNGSSNEILTLELVTKNTDPAKQEQNLVANIVTSETTPTTETGGSTETTPTTEAGGSTETTPKTETGGSTETTPTTETGGSTETTPTTETGGSTETTPTMETGGSTETTPTTETGGSTETTPTTETGGTTETTPTTETGGSTETTPPTDNTTPVESFDNNIAPEIAIIANQSIKTGSLYAYEIVALDSNPEDSLKYSLSTFPNGMSIDETTGQIAWTPGNDQVGSHSITVIVSDNGSPVLTHNQTFNILVELNLPPNGEIVTPMNNLTITVGQSVLFEGRATDSNSNTTFSHLWDFDGAASNTTSENPGAVTFDTEGYYEVTYTVYDELGADPTPSKIGVTVSDTLISAPIISSGSEWKYLDNGSDQGQAWRTIAFDDSSWRSGAAEFGYGDGNEITLVNFGADENNKYITTYYRKSFTISDSSLVLDLTLGMLWDDGAVVYLNGTEINRLNMPSGTISYSTLSNNATSDPQESSFYYFGIDPTLLVDGTNVLAVEIHQFSTSSSDTSFDLNLAGEIGVYDITAPSEPTNVQTSVGANSVKLKWQPSSDADGKVAGYNIYRNGSEMPVGTIYGNSNVTYIDKGLTSARSYNYRITAFDNARIPNESTASAPESIVTLNNAIVETLILDGSEWKYSDDGSDLGSVWNGSNYDDSSWSTGNAQFGYGEGDEITLLNFGADPNNKHITTYFRHNFNVSDTNSLLSLSLELLRDDGAIVYINGREILRSNMPSGTIDFDTLATNAIGIGDEDNFSAFPLSPGYLKQGNNVIAVELHQWSVTTSDSSFDLKLSVNRGQ